MHICIHDEKYWKLVHNRCASLICIHMRFEICDNLIEILTIWLTLWQFDRYLDNSREILTDLGRSWQILIDLGISQQIWEDLDRSVQISTDLGRSAYILHFDILTLLTLLTFDIVDIWHCWHLTLSTFDIVYIWYSWHLTLDLINAYNIDIWQIGETLVTDGQYGSKRC